MHEVWIWNLDMEIHHQKTAKRPPEAQPKATRSHPSGCTAARAESRWTGCQIHGDSRRDFSKGGGTPQDNVERTSVTAMVQQAH